MGGAAAGGLGGGVVGGRCLPCGLLGRRQAGRQERSLTFPALCPYHSSAPPILLQVGDFGLARAAAGAISTATFGTVSHMSPELMADGLLTKAADVWSFGVMCWELYKSVRGERVAGWVGARLVAAVRDSSLPCTARTPPACGGTPRAFAFFSNAGCSSSHAPRSPAADLPPSPPASPTRPLQRRARLRRPPHAPHRVPGDQRARRAEPARRRPRRLRRGLCYGAKAV